jgi:hypothetical protein
MDIEKSLREFVEIHKKRKSKPITVAEANATANAILERLALELQRPQLLRESTWEMVVGPEIKGLQGARWIGFRLYNGPTASLSGSPTDGSSYVFELYRMALVRDDTKHAYVTPAFLSVSISLREPPIAQISRQLGGCETATLLTILFDAVDRHLKAEMK